MKVLVVKPSSLGDVVHSLRVLKQLKVFWPDVKIDWVIKDGLEGILKASGIVDQIYIFHRGKGLFSYLALITEIRQKKYDYVLDMQGLLRSACITKFSNARNKIGRADGREFSKLFFIPIGEKDRKKNIHAIERLIPFLNELGLTDFDKKFPLDFPESNLSSETSIRIPDGKRILLFPESRRKEKEWPFFNQLQDELASRKDLSVVLAGMNKVENPTIGIDLRGLLAIFELPKLIELSDLVISNDSAPLHIASAMMKKTIGLFGPTDETRYGPYPSDPLRSKNIVSESGKIENIKLSQVMDEISKLI